MTINVKYLISSDKSLCVEFDKEISEQINNQVRSLMLAIEQEQLPGVVELVPTYCSLTVHYDPLQKSCAEMRQQLETLMEKITEMELPPSELVRVPVLYGGEEYGPDLQHVAEVNGLTTQQVIDIHTAPEYPIYMMGFTPGFCYLGGMDAAIATPRLESPRVNIPAGSVGIAGHQTGIYPIDSPGGWQLIGRTPLKLYDPQRPRPIMMDAGMHIKFYAIDEAEFERIAAEQQKGGAE